MSATLDTGKYTRKQVHTGWAMFDWANSAFALVISAAIFPFYFTEQIDDSFLLGRMTISDDAIYSYSITAAYLILILTIPLLSGMADSGGKRRTFMKMFTYIGGLACISLFFFTGHEGLWLGVAGFALANIGFGGSLVFYNSFLPIIAQDREMDRLSARGFVLGYIGSVLLLIACLVLILKGPDWGIQDAGLPARISFLLVGIWWIAWAQYTFRRLPREAQVESQRGLMAKGLRELRHVVFKLKGMVATRRFLISFLFYNAGVQTVLYLAGTFAEKELDFEADELIVVILALQLCGAVGAWAFAKLSERMGNKSTLLILVSLWTGVCVLAFLTHEKWKFYLLAVLVGLTMGGIQALSRATYGKLIDEHPEDSASFFSFYNVMYYLSIMMGTFIFGLLSQWTGSMRYSILALGGLFITGALLLTRVRIAPAGKQEDL